MGSLETLDHARYARSKFNLPAAPGWVFFEAKIVVGDVTMLTGGYRKGRYQFAKEGRQTVAVVNSEVEAFRAAEEVRTGKCRECKGTGETLRRWSKQDGAEYQSCARCCGSGIPP
jgi:hypothetical protein